MSTEWDSANYQRLSSPQLEWGRELLGTVELRGDETVLDAGCGTGRVTAELLNRLPRGRVVALDLSLNMVRDARKALAGRFGPHANFVEADLLAMPFRAGFDGIFSTAVFHWVPDHERLFRELFASLRPGGWLVAQCGGGENLKRLRDRANTLLRAPLYAEYFEGWNEPWEYPDPLLTGQRLLRAGFVNVKAGLKPSPARLANAADFSDYQRTVTLHRHLARLPEDLRKDFLHELTQQFAKDDPPFTLDYWRLNLRAMKPV